jgi:hypothetical protein
MLNITVSDDMGDTLNELKQAREDHKQAIQNHANAIAEKMGNQLRPRSSAADQVLRKSFNRIVAKRQGGSRSRNREVQVSSVAPPGLPLGGALVLSYACVIAVLVPFGVSLPSCVFAIDSVRKSGA